MSCFDTTYKQVARKPYRCEVCGATIPPGQEYLRRAGKWEGEFYYSKQHSDCNELWNRVFENWGDVNDGMDLDLREVFLESGERLGAQEELDAHRGYTPHAVCRIELSLGWWLSGEGDE